MAPRSTGSVRQRGRRWHARWQDPTGREHSATRDTRRQAERWIADTVAAWRSDHPERAGRADDAARADDADGRPAPNTAPVSPAETPTVAEFVPIWRATLIDKSPATLARTDSALRAHIVPEWGEQRLDEITTLQVKRWLARLVAEDGLAATSATRMLRILSAMLQVAAEDHGYLAANPARGVRPPRAKTPERRFLTVGELHRVADSIDSRYRSLVLFAGYSGLRFAELTGLRVRDVNPQQGWVRVEHTLTEVAGRLHEGGPKSTAGRRSVSLPPTVLAAIASDLAGKGPDDLVFRSPEGGPLRRTLFAARYWRPALQRAGLPPAGLHTLRHTAVSIWLEAGASLREAQARAGHSSGALTLSIYGHVTPDAYAATTARLEQLASGRTETS